MIGVVQRRCGGIFVVLDSVMSETRPHRVGDGVRKASGQCRSSAAENEAVNVGICRSP